MVRPEVFAVGVEDHGADGYLGVVAALDGGVGGVQLGEQELDEVRFAESGAGEDEAAPGDELADLEPGDDGRRHGDHPRFSRSPGVTARVDELAEGQEPDFGGIFGLVVGVGDLGQQFRAEKGDLRADVGQSPVARHEDQLSCLFAQHSENPDVDLVFEVLVA